MRKFGVIAVLVAVLYAVLTVGIHNTLTEPYPGHNDFLSRWEGARSFWVDGLNPYGEEATLNIQTKLRGRPAEPYEDQGLFAYPFYTVFFVMPFVWVNYAWASAAWMSLLIFCLIGALFLLLNHFRWRPNVLLLMGLILWSLFSYVPGRNLILGQVAVPVYLCQVLAVWALARRRDGVAGVALAVSTIKPQMGYLIVPFLLLWALRFRRWQVVGWFAGVWGALMGASFVLEPAWFNDWLTQVFSYRSYTQLGSPTWIISHAPWLGLNDLGQWESMGGFGDTIHLILSGLGYLSLLWLWFGVLVQQKHDRFMWTIVMTLLITHLVAPSTATTHFIVFMIPLVFYLRWMHTRLKRGSLWIAALLLFVLIEQWVQFVLTIDGDFEDPTMFLPVPLILLVVLLWTRRMWWNDPLDRFQQDANPADTPESERLSA